MPMLWNTLFHLHRQVGVCTHTYLSMKKEQTERSETLAYKLQTPGNYPEESKQHHYPVPQAAIMCKQKSCSVLLTKGINTK